MADGEREVPQRRNLLDGLTPKDFDRHWPNGALVAPEKLRDSGLTREQIRNVVLGVGEVQQLAKDISTYVAGLDTTQEALAARCALNPAIITRLKRGHRFPVLSSFIVLRAKVPNAERMRRGDFGEPTR